MKKILGILSLAVVMMMAAVPADAQVKLGLTGGVNLSKMSLNKMPELSSNNRAGWFVGPKVLVKIPLVGLGADAAVLYSQRRMNVENEAGESASKNYNSVEIPINLRYSVGLSSLASVFLATGPQFGFNVGNKTWKAFDSKDLFGSGEEKFQLKKSNVTWNIGVGAMLLNHVEASVGYNFGVSKLAKRFGNEGGGTIKGNTWQLKVAYYF